MGRAADRTGGGKNGIPVSAGKFVLVIGTGWALPAKRRTARMIGTTLAEAGLGLVSGNSTGVDRWVSDAFCGERELRCRCPAPSCR